MKQIGRADNLTLEPVFPIAIFVNTPCAYTTQRLKKNCPILLAIPMRTRLLKMWKIPCHSSALPTTENVEEFCCSHVHSTTENVEEFCCSHVHPRLNKCC